MYARGCYQTLTADARVRPPPVTLLPLPVPPAVYVREIIPAAMALLPLRLDTPPARVMLTAISLQESGLNDRRQGAASRPGPARGFPQFEETGVRGVVDHVASRALARRVAAARKVAFDARAIHLAMELDDVLGCAFARLLLLTDPRPLPAVNDRAGALSYYLRNWRPGAAKTAKGLAEITQRWARNHPLAVAAVTG